MAPTWLTRLNEMLTWLNPAMGVVAAVLAVMVVAIGIERVHGPRATASSVRVVQLERSAVSVACGNEVMPQSLRDMLLHD